MPALRDTPASARQTRACRRSDVRVRLAELRLRRHRRLCLPGCAPDQLRTTTRRTMPAESLLEGPALVRGVKTASRPVRAKSLQRRIFLGADSRDLNWMYGGGNWGHGLMCHRPRRRRRASGSYTDKNADCQQGPFVQQHETVCLVCEMGRLNSDTAQPGTIGRQGLAKARTSVWSCEDGVTGFHSDLWWRTRFLLLNFGCAVRAVSPVSSHHIDSDASGLTVSSQHSQIYTSVWTIQMSMILSTFGRRWRARVVSFVITHLLELRRLFMRLQRIRSGSFRGGAGNESNGPPGKRGRVVVVSDHHDRSAVAMKLH